MSFNRAIRCAEGIVENFMKIMANKKTNYNGNKSEFVMADIEETLVFLFNAFFTNDLPCT